MSLFLGGALLGIVIGSIVRIALTLAIWSMHSNNYPRPRHYHDAPPFRDRIIATIITTNKSRWP